MVPLSATITVRSPTNGTVRQATWTGQAFLLPELPPDGYLVSINVGNGSALAGSMPVRPWSQTSFTVRVSGLHSSPPPSPAFPWLIVAVLLGGVIAGSAALPLLHYTRLTRETVLQRKARLLLYEYIRDNPGASFSVVRDAFGLQNGAASYHLSVLEKQGFLHSETKGRRHFYYPNGNASLWKDLPLSEFQNAILQAVRAAPGAGLRELGRSLGRGPSSVGYNVKALAREGLLRTVRDGLRLRCYPAEGTGAA
jgi:predicted transcriptional regulator